MLQLEKTQRNQTKMTLCLEGASGTGLTYSSLLIAYGITGDYSKVVIIDTSNRNSSLYSHLGPFNTIHLGAPFHPERFYEAIALCEAAEKQVVIIDSLSSEWTDQGGMVDLLSGSNYQDALRAHRHLLWELSQTPMHVICTVKTKQQLALIPPFGKLQRRLVEMPLQQQGIRYLFHTVFRLDRKHQAHVVKDRTGLFEGKPPFLVTAEVGDWIEGWTKQGEPIVPEDLQERINGCTTVAELQRLLAAEGIEDVDMISAFTKRRLELEQSAAVHNLERIPGGLRL